MQLLRASPLTAAPPTAPGVPIVPETDSAVLLGLGVAAVSTLAVLRRRY